MSRLPEKGVFLCAFWEKMLLRASGRSTYKNNWDQQCTRINIIFPYFEGGAKTCERLVSSASLLLYLNGQTRNNLSARHWHAYEKSESDPRPRKWPKEVASTPGSACLFLFTTAQAQAQIPAHVVAWRVSVSRSSYNWPREILKPDKKP